MCRCKAAYLCRMRVIGTIPHPNLRITVMQMNDKFILRFEAGPMEQIYKFDQQRYPGLEKVQQLADDAFVKKVTELFNAMYMGMKETMDRHPGKD